MKVKVADIHPNPFRHIERYPVNAGKVETLRKSIQSTGFWDNIVARIRDGQVQIAYGHHRWFALKEEYPPDHEVELIIRDLSDEQMIKVMANENMEEWGSSVTVEHETVRAVVEAYARGQITLSKPATRSPYTRYAPSFIPCSPSEGEHPYSAHSVAEFLGWLEPSGDVQNRVRGALSALELIEEGILCESDFKNLGSTQAHAVVDQARRVKREREVQAKLAEEAADRQRKAAQLAEQRRVQAEEDRRQREEEAARAEEEEERQQHLAEAELARQEAALADQQRILAEQRQRTASQKAAKERQKGHEQAQKVALHVSQKIASGQAGYTQARQVADEVREKVETPIPNIDQFALKIAAQIHRILDSDTSTLAADLAKLVKYQDSMTAPSAQQLILELDALIGRAENLRNSLINDSNGIRNGHKPDMIVTEVLQLT